MHFLFLLFVIRLIPGAIIFYILFQDAPHYPVYFCQAVYSLVLDNEIQDLKKAFPDFGEFLFLHVAPCLLGGLGEGIVLFDVVAVI